MISALIWLSVGACIGAFGMAIIAGGKIERLEEQISTKGLDCIDCMKRKCGDCYEIKQLKKSNAALRGDNKRFYNMEHGNKGNSRVLYDLWAQQNKVSMGEG